MRRLAILLLLCATACNAPVTDQSPSHTPSPSPSSTPNPTALPAEPPSAAGFIKELNMGLQEDAYFGLGGVPEDSEYFDLTVAIDRRAVLIGPDGAMLTNQDLRAGNKVEIWVRECRRTVPTRCSVTHLRVLAPAAG